MATKQTQFTHPLIYSLYQFTKICKTNPISIAPPHLLYYLTCLRQSPVLLSRPWRGEPNYNQSRTKAESTTTYDIRNTKYENIQNEPNSTHSAHGSRATGHESRVTACPPRATAHGSRVTIYAKRTQFNS